MKTSACLLVAILATGPSQGATPASQPVPAAPTGAADAATTAVPVETTLATQDCHCVPAGTLVELEIAQPLNSAARKRGDGFALKLHTPITRGGVVVIPAGVTGMGQVVHAQRSKGGGKPGELLLAGRYLEFGETRIPLRGMKASATGGDTYGAALGAAFVVGPFAMFVRGHEIEIPVGARVTAKLAQDLVLPADAGTTPVVVDPPITTVSTKE